MKTKVNTIFIAHNKNWGNTDLYLPEFKKDEPIEMRKFQREVYDNHRDDRFLIINKPQGSGKSSIPKFILTEKLIADPELKVIISYPKNIIAEGFQSQDLIYPDGEKRKWEITPVNNLAGKATSEKVKRVIDFIHKRAPGPLDHRILCTSHAALVQAFKKIKHKSLRKIQIVVDEGHHVQSGGEDDLSDNNLGRIARCLAKNKDNGCGLWLMTATFFRSDGSKVIRDDLRDELFQTYYLPMDTYFNSLRYLKTIQYGYIPYTSDFPEKEIQELLKQKTNRQKVLFFVPAIGRLWVGRNKKHTVKRLKDCIHKVWKEEKILDLVDDEDRGSRKDELMKNRYSSNIDVVLSVCIFNEGTDWPECRNVIDLAPSESIVVGSQRFGRPIRDIKGKTHVNYYNLFPCVSFKDDPEITRQKLSSCWNALAASMVIADAICDYSIPSEDTGEENEEDKEKQPREKRRKYFEEEVKDVAKQQQILSDVAVSYTKKMSECREKGEDFTNDMFEESVKDVLKKYSVVNNQDRIVKEIKAKLVRIAIPKYRVSVSDILSDEYNKITLQKIGDYLMMFSTGKCDGRIWTEIREWYKGQNHTFEEDEKELDAIFKEFGKIPNYTWFIKNNKMYLYSFLIISKELQKKYEWEYSKKPAEEIKKEIENIIKQNGGKIPNHRWFKENDRENLYVFILNNKKTYSQYKDKKWQPYTDRKSNIEEINLIFNKFGKIPSRKWFKENGKENLYMLLVNNKHDKKFKKYNIEWKTPKRKENLQNEIDRIIKNNNGNIPTQIWFKNNGKENLYNFIHRNKKLYQNKEWVIKRKTEDNKNEIEKIINQYGKIPSKKWFDDNNKTYLYRWVSSNPDRKQQYKKDWKIRKSNEDLYNDVKDIIKENGGIIPSCGWFQSHNKNNLYCFIQRNRHLFGGVKIKSQKCKNGVDVL